MCARCRRGHERTRQSPGAVSCARRRVFGYLPGMLTLSLLRHAKSSWDDPALDDFDRPLAKRGIAAARRMGGYFRANDLTPGIILCSDAVRARQTLDLVLPHLSIKPAVIHERDLYLASPGALLERLRKLDAKAAHHALLIGHDPGMHLLARDLVASGEPGQVQALERKFPTAALAVIVFRVREWSRLAPAKGRLKLFVTPKMLA